METGAEKDIEMKRNFRDMIKKAFNSMKPSSVKALLVKFKNKIAELKSRARRGFEEITVRVKTDVKERNRIMLLSLSALSFVTYLMICLLIDKNILDIFPPLPVIETNRKITIYIPSDGAGEIIAEKRTVYSGLDDEKLVHRLFYLVATGSAFENTMSNVPADFLIKKIWIVPAEDGQGKVCLIDLMPVQLEKEIAVVKGSEQMFRDALERTITENIPDIKKVILLEKGVLGKSLWDI